MTNAESFIFGVHHFCDHRCWRCPLAARCRVHDRWQRIGEPSSLRKQPAARVAAIVKTSMEVTIEELEMLAERHGMRFELPLEGEGAAADTHGARAGGAEEGSEHRAHAPFESSFCVTAREYADLSCRALRGLRGLPATQRDPEALDACDRLEEMCFTVASKIVRCVAGMANPEHDPDDVQSDANGAAKVALLLIEESRQAWRVLAQPGRARGGGAPARFVRLLDRLEAGLLQHCPRAFEFVRPGFDTGELTGTHGALTRALLRTAGATKAGPN